MKDNKQIMCDECKRTVPIDDVRYSQKGNQTLRMCSDCRDRTTPRKNKQIDVKLTPNNEKSVKEVKHQKNLGPNKIEYLCTKCKYKFKHDSTGENKVRCPYCSSSAYVTSLKSLSSDKLLKEAKDFD